MKIILAQPRGFCAGVDRAIEIVEKALLIYGAPVYVRHEIVHNKFVVDDLRAKGAVFVKSLAEIPEGSVTIFSAHGVSEQVELEAKYRNLPVIDATCPLVTKVHNQAIRNEKEGRQIILIGHKGHPEVEGTSGRVRAGVLLVQTEDDVDQLQVDDEERLAYVTQTTLSVSETKGIIAKLKARFPTIIGQDTKDICYATQNRQDAVEELARITDLVLVVGSQNSSNSNRLKDLALEKGTKSYLVNGAYEIKDEWLSGINSIGLTAGASAPEILVQEIIEHIKNRFANTTVETMDGITENVNFRLPKELRKLGF
ncbi:MAG TPA: 4-hydroxy-3-methylbut-2-enyl diphosphate reductase [Alphaproteobacteria bacterium]|nr:4-hydroxy-3-methylbut-2-enyl diphosphate reductase [Alphaproteobacteria bacterium]